MAAGRLYVFVRAPRVGAVKRRMAADVGAMAAWRFYRDTARAVIGRVGDDPRWRTAIAVTPDRYGRAGRFWPAHIARVPQGGGDLGRRMARALGRVPYAPAVIIGSDIPDITADHVARAFAALRRADMVFGPAADGGYWLVGARAPARLFRLFENVRWSSPHALADTLAGLDSRRSVVMLETLEDVDDGATLERFQDHRRRPTPPPGHP